MKPDILNYLLPIAGISLALGLLLGWPSKRLATQYDERQLIEMGKAARLSQLVVMVFLMALFIGIAFFEMPRDYILTMVIAGISLVAMTEKFYCIFHDAAVPKGKDPLAEGGWELLLGMVWVFLAMGSVTREIEIRSTQIMLALYYALGGLCMILRAVYLRFQARKEGGE